MKPAPLIVAPRASDVPADAAPDPAAGRRPDRCRRTRSPSASRSATSPAWTRPRCREDRRRRSSGKFVIPTIPQIGAPRPKIAERAAGAAAQVRARAQAAAAARDPTPIALPPKIVTPPESPRARSRAVVEGRAADDDDGHAGDRSAAGDRTEARAEAGAASRDLGDRDQAGPRRRRRRTTMGMAPIAAADGDDATPLLPRRDPTPLPKKGESITIPKREIADRQADDARHADRAAAGRHAWSRPRPRRRPGEHGCRHVAPRAHAVDAARTAPSDAVRAAADRAQAGERRDRAARRSVGDHRRDRRARAAARRRRAAQDVARRVDDDRVAGRDRSGRAGRRVKPTEQQAAVERADGCSRRRSYAEPLGWLARVRDHGRDEGRGLDDDAGCVVADGAAEADGAAATDPNAESRRGEVGAAARRLGDQPRPRIAGWVERAVEGREAARAQGAAASGNRNIAVASAQAIEAVEWEEKPTGIGEALVQIDPTLMEPAQPMPIDDEEPVNIVSTPLVDVPPPTTMPPPLGMPAPHRDSDATAVGAARDGPAARGARADADGAAARVAAAAARPAPRLPTPPPQPSPLFAQAVPNSSAVFPALPPRVDITDGNTNFFRDSGEIPQYDADPTDSIATQAAQAHHVLVIAAAALAVLATVVVILSTGGKKPKHAPVHHAATRVRIRLGAGRSGSARALRLGSDHGRLGARRDTAPPPVDAAAARAAGVQRRHHDDADRRRDLARRQDRARHVAGDGPAAVRRRDQGLREEGEVRQHGQGVHRDRGQHEARAQDRGADVPIKVTSVPGGRDDHGRRQGRRHHADDDEGPGVRVDDDHADARTASRRIRRRSRRA